MTGNAIDFPHLRKFLKTSAGLDEKLIATAIGWAALDARNHESDQTQTALMKSREQGTPGAGAWDPDTADAQALWDAVIERHR